MHLIGYGNKSIWVILKMELDSTSQKYENDQYNKLLHNYFKF